MAESETIFVLVTDGHCKYFSLRLATRPAVKERVSRRDISGGNVSGTATRLEWPPGSDESASIAVPVRAEVHSRFAAVEPIIAGVARDIIMQDRLDGIYIYDDAHAWEGLTYIPVPGRPVNTMQPAAVAQPSTSMEVSPVVSIHAGGKPRRAACPGRARHISNNTKLSVCTQMLGP